MSERKEKMFDRTAIVRWHLEGNIYPPINDPDMAEFALSAVDLGNEGKGDTPVFIYADGKIKNLKDNKTGKEVTANEVIKNWKLEIFLDVPDEEVE